MRELSQLIKRTIIHNAPFLNNWQYELLHIRLRSIDARNRLNGWSLTCRIFGGRVKHINN